MEALRVVQESTEQVERYIVFNDNRQPAKIALNSVETSHEPALALSRNDLAEARVALIRQEQLLNKKEQQHASRLNRNRMAGTFLGALLGTFAGLAVGPDFADGRRSAVIAASTVIGASVFGHFGRAVLGRPTPSDKEAIEQRNSARSTIKLRQQLLQKMPTSGSE